MSDRARIVAVTGASGYLGSQISDRFEAAGWRVLRLVRNPAPGDEWQRNYELTQPLPPGALRPATALVHAAYDFGAKGAKAWTANVHGTRRLLDAARADGVGRIIVLSSMSAYAGTTQLYGRVKLAIEDVTFAAGGRAIRPGFVYGDDPGGIAGALRKLARIPVIPLVAGDSHQFPVHDEDLVTAIVALVDGPEVPAVPVGIAQTRPVPFRDVMRGLAATAGRRPVLVPVPWRLIYWPLRIAEGLGLPLPLRSDSLLGLVRPASEVPNPEIIRGLGVQLRSFPGGSR